ncbi:MAG TPA: FAD-dependent oxidoreductase [Deltaproteobacteria bacterium]|nr:FAD-dependent oxidoreductase [Deltaproteobacteria bacterium]HPR53598.1 FAD-dependent oxidoreductase [Deltaproteobacteria bacterium]HXK47113.1 FAD-dependent oxidoreductase [Deltaproteobacteria bacterium]
MADVVIIGAGPAGIFAARELALNDPSMEIVIIEQGNDIHARSRTGREMLVGWGGAGAYSDGKLTISTDVGGQLSSLVADEELLRLLEHVDGLYTGYAPSGDLFTVDSDDAEAMTAQARLSGLVYVPTRVRHIGTENLLVILERLRHELDGRVRMIFNTMAKEILHRAGAVTGVELSDGTVIQAPRIIAAPGRVGSSWMSGQAKKLGLETHPNPVDLGVRVELPAAVMEHLTSKAYETKYIHYSRTFDDKVRTFCMNPYGEVVIETLGDIVTVNGHSWANKRTENTNFALLVSANFTEPFDDPIGYGESVARLANMLGKGVIVQRLGDLLSGRRTTQGRLQKCTTRSTLKQATPGDLSYCLPYRILTDIVEMLSGLDRIAPGVNSAHTLLYGIEVKFYSNRIRLDRSLGSQMDGLYVIGDGAGITRGLIQASCSGIIAARSILGLNQ